MLEIPELELRFQHKGSVQVKASQCVDSVCL